MSTQIAVRLERSTDGSELSSFKITSKFECGVINSRQRGRLAPGGVGEKQRFSASEQSAQCAASTGGVRLATVEPELLTALHLLRKD